MQKMTSLFLSLAASPLVLAQQVPQALPSVEEIRVGTIPGRTRMVFDLSAPADYRSLDGQDAITLIIDAEQDKTALSGLSLAGTFVTDISTSQNDDGTLSYQVSFEAGTQAKLFDLAPYEGRGYRLVLDLYAADEPLPDDATQASDEDAATDMAPSAASDDNGDGSDINAASVTAATGAAATSAAGTTRRSRFNYHFDEEEEEEDSGWDDEEYGDESDAESQWSGYLSFEPRLFFDDATYDDQDDQNLSFAAEAEYYRDWDDGRQRLAFRPFGRFDANDEERTHADIRELYWRYEQDNYLLKAGLDVVFWGVAESRHLVDIINQTDLVENIDGEDKLGQPMLNMDYMSDNWGTLHFYVLPYFRERTFPGEDGRLRTEPAIDEDDAEYDSSDEEEHIDFALRWSHYIGDWDVGLAHFSGTSRDPLLLPDLSSGELRIIPLYPQVDQTSLDTQATLGAWLLKLEAIYNDNDFDSYYAYVGGFEYTFYGVRDSAADMGLLLEYNYDEREEDSTSALQDDVYLGLRWSGNDTDSTELLAALVYDLDNDSTFGNIEASRRLGEHWTLGLEVRVFTNVDYEDLLRFIEDDDYAEIQLTRHF